MIFSFGAIFSPTKFAIIYSLGNIISITAYSPLHPALAS